MQEMGIHMSNERTNFHLFQKLSDVAEQAGWETVLMGAKRPIPLLWDGRVHDWFDQIFDWKQPKNNPIMEERVRKIVQEKKILNFPVEMYILRKKSAWWHRTNLGLYSLTYFWIWKEVIKVLTEV